jgi:integrase/recombinase XerD
MIFTIIKDLAVKIELHKRLVHTFGIRLRHLLEKGRFEVYPINEVGTEIYLHLDRKFLTEVINTIERI